MKKIIFIVSFILLRFICIAQDVPLYNNFYSNPFFYNPSFAGSKKQSELTILYRQQWTGLEGAPKFTNLTLTTPINRLGFGMSIHNTTRGLITTSSAQIAFSYKVPFSTNTSLAFGIAAGVGRNTLDMNQVDMNDPVIARILNNSYYFEGQAGFNFQHKNLVIGFSLPQFFDRMLVDVQSLQTININPFNASISSIRVKFNLGSSLSFEPILLFKTNRTTSQWEVYGTFYVKETVWFGGLYRQNFGADAHAGFQVNKLLQFGYSYEFPTNDVSQFNFNTHEFRLTLLLRKEKIAKKKSIKPKALPAGLKRKY